MHSLFDPVFSIRPLLLKRLGLVDPRIAWLMAPRGELSPARWH